MCLTEPGLLNVSLLRLFATVVLLTALIAGTTRDASATVVRVPQDQQAIQAGIDAAKAGDTVLVAAGTYQERIRLKSGVTLKSVGDDSKGELGLKRAEATIINGSVKGAKGAGVPMTEDTTLDGFTVTGVGEYDDKRWKKHHATQGEEQSHEHIGVPGTAGIAVIGVTRCTVSNNIVHHIGYTGIAIVGVKDKRVSPHIVRNVTYRNMGGGIGSMKESMALIEENVCFENFYAGIGHNNASGGGVAGVLAHGNVQVIGNRFKGKGPGQGSAVWVWKDSNVTVANNRVQGYRNAVNASGSQVTATDNVTRAFEGQSIVVKKPSLPAHVFGNTAISENPKDTAANVDGEPSAVESNVLKKPKEVDESRYTDPPIWPLLSREAKGNDFHTLANTGRQIGVEEGPWKLVATYGKTTTYALFNSEDDPQNEYDLSIRLEQITFRLRGLLEKKENIEYQSEMHGKRPGR